MRVVSIMGAAILLALASACGSTNNVLEAGEGDLTVDWGFDGVETPSKVNVYVIDGKDTNATCSTLPHNPSEDAWDSKRNQPVGGSVDFTEMTEGDRWIVWAVGHNAGVQVADACRDRVQIRKDKVTTIDLNLRNRPMGTQGKYVSDLELDFDIPGQAMSALIAFDIACEAFDLSDDLCKISSGVTNLLADLDAEAVWQFNQNGDFIRGEMDWVTVEGKDVGPEWKLVSGGFNGEIPGATQINIVTHDMKVHMDQVVLFMIQEVEGYDLDDYAPQVEMVVDAFASDLLIRDGSAVTYDNDFDGRADSVSGFMDAEIELTASEYVHRIDLDWTAYKQ